MNSHERAERDKRIEAIMDKYVADIAAERERMRYIPNHIDDRLLELLDKYPDHPIRSGGMAGGLEVMERIFFPTPEKMIRRAIETLIYNRRNMHTLVKWGKNPSHACAVLLDKAAHYRRRAAEIKRGDGPTPRVVTNDDMTIITFGG